MSSDTTPAPSDPTTVVRQLLDLTSWQAFDIDADGRVLAGHDALGSLQLVEIDTDGTRTPLTDLPSRCSGRYVPGRRQVVVQHDNGGDELMQLSLLSLDPLPTRPVTLDELTPLVRDPASMHVLRDVTPGTVVYSTNRRNQVDMDVVVRDLATGEETCVYDGGGYVADTVVSADHGSVAITALSLRPASTRVFLAGPRAVGDGAVTDPDEHAQHHSVAWAAGDEALLLSSNSGREFTAVFRVSLDGASWQPLVVDDEHDLLLWTSPDASAMVVGTLVDGALRLAVHEADGTPRCAVELPEPGTADVVWAADSSRFVLTVSASTSPASLYSVDAATGQATLLVDGREQLPGDLAGRLAEPTVHRVPTPDDELVPCFLFRPPV
ncbi:S9 family peptidase, partial [Auraticoccus sp. F435]|nr:S9 family peptidase [Auraticoccus cholistanensis]